MSRPWTILLNASALSCSKVAHKFIFGSFSKFCIICILTFNIPLTYPTWIS